MRGSALYLYGFLAEHGREALPSLKGLGHAPVETLEMEGCAALVSDHDGAEIPKTRSNVTAHGRVLEAGMQVGTLLPMRFGSVARDEPALRGFVAAHTAEIAAQLERLEGCIEIDVTVSLPRAAALAALCVAEPALVAQLQSLAEPEAEADLVPVELGGRVAERLDARRKAAERALLGRIAPAVRAHVLNAPEEDADILRAAFLISAPDEAAFVETLSAAARDSDFAPGAEPRIVFETPAPPYHFVNLQLPLKASATRSVEA